VDALKIDRSFTCRVDTDAETAKMVRIIVMLADGLHLKVVAEGVERKAQVDFLKDLGCELAQGYCIPNPSPYRTLKKISVRNVFVKYTAQRPALDVQLVAYDGQREPLNLVVGRSELRIPVKDYANVQRAGLQIHKEIDIPQGGVFLRTGIYDRRSSMPVRSEFRCAALSSRLRNDSGYRMAICQNLFPPSVPLPDSSC
jgi:EAL domain